MKYKRLGTGLLESELCLGTMTFGGEGETWKNMGALDVEQAGAMFRTAFDAGVNFVETADVYGEGRSEEITGISLRNLGIRREDFVVATKVFGPTGAGPNSSGASRAHILRARRKVKESGEVFF
jgi:aryl-alcohol dehydrogenase-like predicted oxidoreductase